MTRCTCRASCMNLPEARHCVGNQNPREYSQRSKPSLLWRPRLRNYGGASLRALMRCGGLLRRDSRTFRRRDSRHLRAADAGRGAGARMTTLSASELRALTGAATLRRQVSRLVALGIPFAFGGGMVAVQREVAKALPQWQSIEASKAPRLDLVR